MVAVAEVEADLAVASATSMGMGMGTGASKMVKGEFAVVVGSEIKIFWEEYKYLNNYSNICV